jgi:hypothetical protein
MAPVRCVRAFAVLCLIATPAAAAPKWLAAQAAPSHLFEENLGQMPSTLAFRMRGRGLEGFIARDGSLILQTNGDKARAIGIEWIDSDPPSAIRGSEQAQHRLHFMRAGEPDVVDVGAFGRVAVDSIYPGVALEYHAAQSQFEFDFVVQPGAAVERIAMRIRGADAVLEPNGELVLQSGGRPLRQRKPVAYQVRDGHRHEVACEYRRIAANQFGFALGEYDRSLPLVIDPVVEYASYLGGSAHDEPMAARIGADGSLYVVGRTTSSNFPRVAALDTSLGGVTDVFVSKVNQVTGKLVYSTYIGGSNDDEARGVAVGNDGAVYIVGKAGSRYPTVTGAYQSGSVAAGFVTKLNAAGSAMVYSTLLLGTVPLAVDVDGSGQVYVTGRAGTSFVRTPGAFQASYGGAGNASDPTREGDAFLVKLNAAGSAALVATYIGGAGNDVGNSIALDSLGRIVVAGTVPSGGAPVAKAITSSTSGGYLIAMNADGISVAYATYLGASLKGVAAGPGGSVAVAGDTSNLDSVPMVNAVLGRSAIQPGGGFFVSKPFVARLQPAATTLDVVFSSFIGTVYDCCDEVFSVAMDGVGDVHLVYSTDVTRISALPQPNAFMPASFAIAKNAGANSEMFVAAGYARDGKRLRYQSVYSSCGEGIGSCVNPSVHARGPGQLLIAGGTQSAWMPVAAKNHQAAYGGGLGPDGYILTFHSDDPDLTLETTTPTPVANQPLELVARSYVPGASGLVTFWNGAQQIGQATLADGIARLTKSDMPTGVGRFRATLGTSEAKLLLPIAAQAGSCP